jgi:hypothetical protein
MKNSVFWDIKPRSLLNVSQHIGGTCCLHHQDRRIKQIRKQSCLQKRPLHWSFAMLVMTYQNIQYHISHGHSLLYLHDYKNLKYLILFIVVFGAYVLTVVQSNFKMHQRVSTMLVLSALQVYLLKQDPKLNLRICLWQVHSGRFLVSFVRC